MPPKSALQPKLIHLESCHPAVVETIRRIVTGENDVAYAAVRDFDGCEYPIAVTEDASAIVISVRHSVPPQFFAKTCESELRDVLTRHFGDALITTEDGCVASVSVALPEDEPARVVGDPVVAKAANLRCLCIASVFLRAVKAATTKQPFAVRVPYRHSESLYVYTDKAAVNAVVSIVVDNIGDRLLVRTFLTEMAEAKKQGKTSGGPGFFFTQGQPPSLTGGLSPAEPADERTFWCTFTLSQKSMATPNDTERAAEFIVNFRAYVMYHMQCARSSMHARMRERVKTSLQVLNRAKTATTGKARITIS